MIEAFFLRKLLTPILVIGFFLFGLFTFGNATPFDLWFLVATLLLAGVSYRTRDFNVTGLAVFFAAARLVEELWYRAFSLVDMKVMTYTVVAIGFYRLKYNALVRYLCIPLFVLMLCAELYWHVIDYPAPLYFMYSWFILLNAITMHLIFIRVPLTEGIRPGIKSLPLDWQLYRTCQAGIVLIAIMIVEYIIRHVTAFNPTLVYSCYPKTMHAINVITLFYVVRGYLHAQFKLNA